MGTEVQFRSHSSPRRKPGSSRGFVVHRQDLAAETSSVQGINELVVRRGVVIARGENDERLRIAQD